MYVCLIERKACLSIYEIEVMVMVVVVVSRWHAFYVRRRISVCFRYMYV